MKAIGLYKAAPVETDGLFREIDMETPKAEGRDILVRVKGVAVNPVDFKVRRGKADDGNFKILGWDAAGVVEAVGEDVTLFRPGDEVWYAGDVTRSGSNAQFQLVDERIVGPKPKSLGFADAAALPLTTITAWEALFDRMMIDRNARDANAGKVLLVIGGAGGVGSIAIQFGKLAGLTVIATASRPETIDWVKKLGADQVINHRNPLNDELTAIGIAHVDYILCTSETDQYFDVMAEIIAPQGRIATITEASENHNVDLLKAKSASFSYEFMFTRSMFLTPDMIEQHKLLATVADLIDAGTLKNTANESFGALTPESLRKAHALLESGKAIGKITFEGIAD
ncbi:MULTISPECIES: zinc-binding alcohol dehydrogenase family protein [Thalassospira]|uniref:Zinc-type alcohol dehydrogenase-like protein n=1 Tax=Thalassospira xiamenensis TaxID=220697 RepID=A0ABR5XZY8_9PROT|nr:MULTISPECIES: zinc-binding alcohol dehydrogenase family protein [Thalassospira]MBL4842247.1 zinc-binding alcohol dehydrogenase family protein [Thalassospira sp.]MBR9782238.1 zinc-binding alcohol dehydrogenase family protein [Rhodospirillales bacterium]KZD02763.1 alcohol dehydrogenase [Thalassospira xiamenensis]KZD09926.1 alcohol dehydrogenase [Thalassospira xiamenensis]MBR9818915.1 zinc-binding alcohol dehydrogenase family protein [Rhodospirillales bacterium]